MIDFPSRVSLIHAPTPLQPLARTGGVVRSGQPRLWVKRDDLTGLGLSGNKIRKLEFVLAEAQRQGADTLITCGGVQSNHCRATAVAAARLGLACHLLLRCDSEPVPDGNLFVDYLCGARVSLYSRAEYRSHQAELLVEAAERCRRDGGTPYVIPTGASDEVGVWGYVDGAQELLADCDREGLAVDAIVHATGSGGTQAGLMAGLALAGRTVPVWGVNVCDNAAYFVKKISDDLATWRERYRQTWQLEASAIRILEGYMGPGYARTTPALLATIRDAARREGLLLDPVYTGKAFQGLLAECEPGGCFHGLRDVVFVHTGGFFGSFAVRETLLAEQAQEQEGAS